jgi:hypothetical protein
MIATLVTYSFALAAAMWVVVAIVAMVNSRRFRSERPRRLAA